LTGLLQNRKNNSAADTDNMGKLSADKWKQVVTPALISLNGGSSGVLLWLKLGRLHLRQPEDRSYSAVSNKATATSAF